jgi:hypothetical protein
MIAIISVRIQVVGGVMGEWFVMFRRNTVPHHKASRCLIRVPNTGWIDDLYIIHVWYYWLVAAQKGIELVRKV